jgi:hypothetical protein
LKHNDSIKLIINNSLLIDNIIDFSTNIIIVNKWKNFNYNDDILIYGICINNAHLLDHSYLGILGIGCLQELINQIEDITLTNKKIQEMIDNQDNIINKLENIVNTLL